MSRDAFAVRIMAGICAGDWKFEIPEGKTWDEMAAKRAYEIADAMRKESEIDNVQGYGHYPDYWERYFKRSGRKRTRADNKNGTFGGG